MKRTSPQGEHSEKIKDDKTKARLAQGVRFHRAMRGLTQRELAELSGVSVITIHRIEQQQISPLTTTVAQLARALGCKAKDLTRAYGGA